MGEESVRTVELAVSPGHTWITSPNSDVAWFVREALAASGASYGYARQGGRIVDLIVDLGDGEVARDACEALSRMGVQIRWHMDQDPAVCDGSWERKLVDGGSNHQH